MFPPLAEQSVPAVQKLLVVSAQLTKHHCQDQDLEEYEDQVWGGLHFDHGPEKQNRKKLVRYMIKLVK